MNSSTSKRSTPHIHMHEVRRARRSRLPLALMAMLLAPAVHADAVNARGAATPVPISRGVPMIALADPLVPEAAVTPDALLSAATVVVMANLKEDRNLQTNNPAKFAELMRVTILPLFDFNHMTRLAVARNWRLASAEQQVTLVADFSALLIRTYSTALAQYREQVITYKTVRLNAGDTEVTVKSTVKQASAERLTIDYDMEKTPTGWKVYDIKIGGISLITTYRSTFAQVVRDEGVDGLIRMLAAKNLQAESSGGSNDAARPFVFMYSVMPAESRGQN